jgi:hypothetical protein
VEHDIHAAAGQFAYDTGKFPDTEEMFAHYNLPFFSDAMMTCHPSGLLATVHDIADNTPLILFRTQVLYFFAVNLCTLIPTLPAFSPN